MRRSLFTLLLGMLLPLLASTANAGVVFARQMNSTQRQEVLEILGLSSGGKILSDPYPLGGYAGLELGATVESISTEDVARLGAVPADPQQEVTYMGFTMGKGVYNNVDLFLHFVPYLPRTEVSRYGAMVRWGFYQAQFFPLSLSININAEIANFSNVLSARTVGADLVGGINVKNVAIYVGAGPVSSTGTFIGGPSGLPCSPATINQCPFTDDGSKRRETVKTLHSVIGVSVAFGKISITGELDRYTQPVYSGKVGFRF